jgi:hypothetical protein
MTRPDPGWSALAAANTALAGELLTVGGGVGERRHQQPGMRRAIAAQTGWTVDTHEKTLPVCGWCHPPAGIDVDATDPVGGRWIGELKLRETDQILWDLLKVADALRLDGIAAGFLQVGAIASVGAPCDMCLELLQRGATEHDVVRLFQGNQAAWSNLLQGGTARPVEIPSVIGTEVLDARAIRLDRSSAQLILLAVEPDWSTPIHMDPDWWCGDWPPAVQPHKRYVEWRRRHCQFLRALDTHGPLPNERAQALSRQHGLNLERDCALTHACEPLVTQRPTRCVTDAGRQFLQKWQPRMLGSG